MFLRVPQLECLVCGWPLLSSGSLQFLLVMHPLELWGICMYFHLRFSEVRKQVVILRASVFIPRYVLRLCAVGCTEEEEKTREEGKPLNEKVCPDV